MPREAAFGSVAVGMSTRRIRCSHVHSSRAGDCLIGCFMTIVQNTGVNLDTFVQTQAAPPRDFAWAWALERPAAEPLSVHVVPEIPIEARKPPGDDELILWFGVPSRRGSDPLNCLSEDERMRALRFQFEADRWAFSAAHAGLRALLGPMLGYPPEALRILPDVNGKPHLYQEGPCAAVQFSLSHTRGCVAVAVAKRAVGVDVELRRTVPDLIDVARTAFAPECHAALVERSRLAARTALFFRYWTLSEAFAKATGEGFTQDLSSFAFTDEGAPALKRVSANRGPPGRWRFYCEP